MPFGGLTVGNCGKETIAFGKLLKYGMNRSTLMNFFDLMRCEIEDKLSESCANMLLQTN